LPSRSSHLERGPGSRTRSAAQIQASADASGKETTMTQAAQVHQKDKLLYTAKVHTMGGRQHGVARSSDGNLEVKLAEPGTGRPGTNPEQLLAAGWSACFESALGIAALKRRIKLSSDP